MVEQAWQDKQNQFFGSSRFFGSGIAIGSSTAWTSVGFSGTTTGFGPHGNIMSQRISILSSGNSVGQLSFDGGTTLIPIYAGDSLTFDGMSHSGLDLRSSSASQLFRVMVW